MTETLSHLPLTFLFLALLVWETVSPSKTFAYRANESRVRHGVANLGVGFLGAALSYILFWPVWRLAARWSGDYNFGLLHIAPVGIVGGACLAIVLLDFWTYWWHRMNHRVPFFWRFHRAHHTDPWLDVTSSRRFHPGEMIFSSALRVPVILFSGVELWHVALYDLIMLAVVMLHHSNIAFSPDADYLLRFVIPTPVMHKIHHSRLRAETDSNYTSLFSIWDRLFGSFRLRPDWRNVSFGLGGYDDPAIQGFFGMLKTPFRPGPNASASRKKPVCD